MRISCLFVASVLGSLPATIFAAQSAPNTVFTVSPASLLGTAPQMVMTLRGNDISPNVDAKPLDDEAMQKLVAKAEQKANDAMTKSVSRCYSIESYRFTRQSPDSDAMRLTDHSACQPSAQFQLKPTMPPAKTTGR